MAVLSGAEAAVLFHIRRGVDLNATDSEGRSPLMLAVIKGHNATCRMLLESGSDPFLVDKSGKDALALANLNNHSDITSLLASYLPPAVHPPAPLPSQTDSIDTSWIETGRLHELEKDDASFNLWEEQLDTEVPPHDEQTTADAGFIQFVVSGHRPIDTAEDWDDVDIDLPDLPTRGRSQQLLEEDGRLHFRHLVLAGLSLGSVPLYEVDSLAGIDQSDEVNIDVPQRLSRVFDELGIIIDDTPLAAFWRDTERDDTIGSELTADSAAHFLEDLSSTACDPLNQYMKEVGPRKVLSREEEAGLGKALEDGIRGAIRSLADCPSGFLEFLTVLHTTEEGESETVTNEPDLLSLSGTSQDADVGVFEHNDDPSALLGFTPPQQAPLETTSIRARYLRSLQCCTTTAEQNLEKETAIEDLISTRLPWRIVQNLSQLARMNAASETIQLQIESALERASEAREKFAEANLRLVISIARKYSSPGMDLMDLIQEGNIGLLVAIDRYDFRLGFKFSTYASWWIKQAVTRAIANQSRTIRLPVHMSEKLTQTKRTQLRLQQELKREPPAELIAESMEVPVSKVYFLLQLLDDTLSLDAGDVGETLVDHTHLSAESIIFEQQVRRDIDSALNLLPGKEKMVLARRFGLQDGTGHTLEEIGDELNVTRERIRQIEVKALNKLRHPSRSLRLIHAFQGTFQEEPQHLESQP